MASNKSESDRELKYLGFVRVIAMQAMVCVLRMYEYVKQHSGPFKFICEIKERVATALVTPFFYRIKFIPEDILFYFDNKVDEVVSKFEELAPALAKRLLIKLQPVVQKVIEIAQNLLQEAITTGVTAAISSAFAESMKLMPKIPTLDSIPNLSTTPIGDVAEKGISAIGDVAEKGASAIGDVAEKGLSILGNMPLNPLGGLLNKQDGDEATTAVAG